MFYWIRYWFRRLRRRRIDPPVITNVRLESRIKASRLQ